jgi:hypothetical protein
MSTSPSCRAYRSPGRAGCAFPGPVGPDDGTGPHGRASPFLDPGRCGRAPATPAAMANRHVVRVPHGPRTPARRRDHPSAASTITANGNGKVNQSGSLVQPDRRRGPSTERQRRAAYLAGRWRRARRLLTSTEAGVPRWAGCADLVKKACSRAGRRFGRTRASIVNRTSTFRPYPAGQQPSGRGGRQRIRARRWAGCERFGSVSAGRPAGAAGSPSWVAIARELGCPGPLCPRRSGAALLGRRRTRS